MKQSMKFWLWLSAYIVAVVGFVLTASWLVYAGPADHEPSQHHRATVEYRGTPCEEDEVLWWVSDGVRACTPLDDIEGR